GGDGARLQRESRRGLDRFEHADEPQSTGNHGRRRRTRPRRARADRIVRHHRRVAGHAVRDPARRRAGAEVREGNRGDRGERRAFLPTQVLRSLRALRLLSFAALIGTCSGPARRADLRAIPNQNVLLITIDTLRADALGCYGGPAATPALDRLAAEGIRFDFAHAHAVTTLTSHASILTGAYPFQHGIRDNSGYRLAPGARTIATLLKQAGSGTAAFVGAFP